MSPSHRIVALAIVASACTNFAVPGMEGGGPEPTPPDTYAGPICSTDGSCNADCPRFADLDCDAIELPEADGSHVVSPSEPADCDNVHSLAASALEGPGDFVLGTDGAACAVYEVSSNLYVNPDQTLTIEAGVTLRFAAGTMLRVRRAAALFVRGAADAPVVFTGSVPEPGHWVGIRFDDTLDRETLESEVADSSIEHAVIEHGGASGEGGDANVSIYRARVRIANSLIRESSAFGVELREHAVLTEFDGNRVTANADAPVWAYPLFVPALTSNNDYTGNAVDRIEVFSETGAPGRFSAPDTGDITWSRLNVPYHVIGSELVFQVVWTIEAGARFEVAEGLRIIVESEGSGLVARGTEELPIVFTADEPTMGYWRGLVLENSARATNALTHVHISYGGGADTVTHRAGLTITSSLDRVNVQVVVEGCIFRESGYYGVEIRNSDVPDGLLELNTFVDSAIEELNVLHI